MKFKYFIVILFVCFFSQSVFARPLTTHEKLSDFRQLLSTIKSGYGPLHYKKARIGLDLKKLSRKYAKKVMYTKSNGEFYYLINQFIGEFQDGHFYGSVPTTHASTIPFATALVNGKVLIDQIDRKKLSQDKFPFERGDEVMAVDEVPVEKVLTEMGTYWGSGHPLSLKSRMARWLTRRYGAFLPVQTGEVIFSIRRGTSNVIEDVTLTWEESGAPLDERIPETPKNAFLQDDYQPPMNYDLLGLPGLLDDPVPSGPPRSFGQTRIAIPKDATIIMKDPFVAYYHPTEKGNIGYLRLPYYWPTDQKTLKLDLSRFDQYEYAVKELEANTVGLIVDQGYNPGGSVVYIHQMLGLFANEPYLPLQVQFMANKKMYLAVQDWLTNHWAIKFYKHTIAHENIQKVIRLIKENWLAGKFLTPKTGFYGEDLLQPNSPVNYTKPIIVLIDEACGSGGDIFPAILQGVGRAKLLGTRTQGAGGHIEHQPNLNYSQMTIWMTKSLVYRPDGVAVENNGAVPDYPYTITRDDFLYEYKDYQKFYLQKLFELIDEEEK